MLKKCQVVMLPTNKKAPIADNYNTLFLANGSKDKLFDTSIYFEGDKDLKLQHIYILSDEEIKQGDYKMIIDETSQLYGQFEKHLGTHECNDQWKKIIATTDNSLKIDTKISIIGETYRSLPRPSQSFLEEFVEEYNKGNIIKEVMVEYYFTHETNCDKPLCVKIDKNNIITIKPIKDNWNRQEVENIVHLAWKTASTSALNGNITNSKDCQSWIEQNI